MNSLLAQRVYRWLRLQAWLYDVEHDSMHPKYRRLVHALLRFLTRLYSIRYRVVDPFGIGRKDMKTIRLNLGSGREPLPDWINVDINPFSGADVLIDLRDPWPFSENQAQGIYLRHCLEHFSESEAIHTLAKCYRVLAPGKGMRIGVPSLECAIQHYLEGDFLFAAWVTDHAKSSGRQFFAYMMDNGNHKTMFDYGYLAELLTMAGFSEIWEAGSGKSEVFAASLLSPKDNPGDTLTLYVECRK